MEIETDGGNTKNFLRLAKTCLGIKFWESYDEKIVIEFTLENIKLKELRPILDNDDYFSGWIEDSVDMKGHII